MIELKPMSPGQWRLHKTMRCAALADAPYAYSNTLEDALKRSDEDWAHLTRRYTSDPSSITYFAFDNQIACGMSACVIDEREAEMFGVWVAPTHRRKGVGSALIKFACTWAESYGAVRLNVGVYEDNTGALALYRSVGFCDSGLTKPELSTGGRTVLLLTMPLHLATAGKD
jgi:ribosomal protein S18 acetylase RimI-like enzyme